MRTYLDTGVLILACRGTSLTSIQATQLLNNKSRTFVSSEYLKLERYPKATYFGQSSELRFYRSYIERAAYCAPNAPQHLEQALALACTYGLNAIDSLHLNIAILNECQEFITTERENSPIFRVKQLQITNLSRVEF